MKKKILSIFFVALLMVTILFAGAYTSDKEIM